MLNKRAREWKVKARRRAVTLPRGRSCLLCNKGGLSMSAVFAPVVIAVLMFTGGDDEKGYLGVQLKKEADDGPIVIQAVVDDSPAAKAGLKEDDVIFKLNGDEVTDLGAFVKKIGESKPGDE